VSRGETKERRGPRHREKKGTIWGLSRLVREERDGGLWGGTFRRKGEEFVKLTQGTLLSPLKIGGGKAAADQDYHRVKGRGQHMKSSRARGTLKLYGERAGDGKNESRRSDIGESGA